MNNDKQSIAIENATVDELLCWERVFIAALSCPGVTLGQAESCAKKAVFYRRQLFPHLTYNAPFR